MDVSGTLSTVARYYSRTVRAHGATARGVDWPCALTQDLRFVQLLRIAGRRRRFSLNDLGCGYGALLALLRTRYKMPIDYAGVDIAAPMIAHARTLWATDPLAQFGVSSALPRQADFSVASGVFNVQLGHGAKAWTEFIRSVLHELRAASKSGFAVNFVLPPERGVEPLEGLYRTRPAPWVEYCSKSFGAQVEVIEKYGLREFTLLARLG
ncbi:MAG: putative S-adenosyl-L-methionine (SAM)-dependent methyltransferase [Ramlibacter sp.]|nr:putative S-adenosyl-L-methionine (SAM)-dependent methyltransferase [Ramlibacter sp.]